MKGLAAVVVLAAMVDPCSHRHEGDGVPVFLSVRSNPPTDVAIVPPSWDRERTPVSLGRTPVEHAPGAQVGDTIRLTNPDAGISYEEVIEYGQPGGTWRITKAFRQRSDAGVDAGR